MFFFLFENKFISLHFNLMKKNCIDVERELKLQPVNNDEARLDVRVSGFWRPGQSPFDWYSSNKQQCDISSQYTNWENL